MPDMEMLSTATEACSRTGDSEGALHFLEQAIGLGLSPDGRMFREVRNVGVTHTLWTENLGPCGAFLLLTQLSYISAHGGM